jgi:hypothetical protein
MELNASHDKTEAERRLLSLVSRPVVLLNVAAILGAY